MNPLPIKSTPYAPGSDEEEIHLHDYLNVLMRRRKLFLWGFASVFLLVALYTFISQPLYEATATLHVSEEQVKGQGFLEDLGLSRDNPIETEIEILKSRTNAEDVVRRLHLDWRIDKKTDGLDVAIGHFRADTETPEFRITVIDAQTYEIRGEDLAKPLRGQVGELLRNEQIELSLEKLRGQPGDSLRLTQLPFNATVQALRNSTRATEVGKGTNIIRLAYQSPRPHQAQEIVNTLAQVYLERSVSLKTEEASRSVEFINGQLDNFRTILDEAERNLETYKSNSGVITLEEEARKLLSMMTELEKRQAETLLRRQQARFAYLTLEKALATGQEYAPSVLLDDPVVASLAEKLAQTQVEKRSLLADLTENHPKVLTINETIRGYYLKLLNTYEHLVDGLDKTTRGIKGELADLEQKLKNLPEAERELARLTRQATVSADIYIFLLQKHEEARIAKAATISNINVIDPAILPAQPIKPRKKKNLLLGLLVGAMLGVGLAFFQEYLDDTINDVETAKRLLGFPLLAVIPHIRRKEGDSGAPQRTLISHLEPKSAATEAFRSLRTAVHFSSTGLDKNLLLITSAFPGEGKTTVAANLAVIMAQTGQRICLLGCDLRRPSLHELFHFERTPGLTEVLIGDATLDEAIHQTDIENLSFIGSGITPPNPSELLGSSNMDQLLANLAERYDCVLLDAPPLLPVTDAALLAPKCDQTMLVIEAGGVPIKAAKRMVELLHAGNAQVAGMVFNDKTGKAAEYYSSYRDRYYGRYAGPYAYGYYSQGYGESEAPQQHKTSWFKRFLRRL